MVTNWYKVMTKSCRTALVRVQTWGRKSFAGMPNWLWAVVVTVVISIGIYAFVECQLWCWLRDGTAKESHGDTLRNLMLVLAAVIGLPLAIWRSTTAHKQANVAQQQADVAQKSLQNERYQRSVEMIGSHTLATRIGGIYALEHLAQEHHGEYHIQIMELLCVFIRHPDIGTSNTGDATQPQEETNPITLDVQAALTVIGRRNQEQRNLEKREEWYINFFRTHLENANLWFAHLERALLRGVHLKNASLRLAHLEDANLSDAHLEGADLSLAHLERANLKEAHLEHAILRKAHLQGTNLIGAHLQGANLWRAHLEGAYLMDAHLERTNLIGAHLQGADLMGAHLEGANLARIHLEGAYLGGAYLENVKGLTQTMLDNAAHHEPDGELLPTPELMGAYCAESGEPLVWLNSPNS